MCLLKRRVTRYGSCGSHAMDRSTTSYNDCDESVRTSNVLFDGVCLFVLRASEQETEFGICSHSEHPRTKCQNACTSASRRLPRNLFITSSPFIKNFRFLRCQLLPVHANGLSQTALVKRAVGELPRQSGVRLMTTF